MEQSTNNPVANVPEDKNFEIANRVFDLEPLRETILNFVIHDNGKVHYSSVKSCRLINKAWLQSTSRILRISGKPLFNLKLFTGYPGEMNKSQELLTHFLESVTRNSPLEQRVPPYSIHCNSLKIFHPRRFHALKSLFDCIVYCGGGLINLSIAIPEDYHSILLNTNVMLPELREFIFLTEETHLPTPSDFDDKTDFIQKVINSTEKLKTFEFQGSSNYRAPSSIGKLLLPPSITTIELSGCLLTEQTLELLVRNQLPSLKKLYIRITGLPFQEDGVFTRLLQNFANTLEDFSVSVEDVGKTGESSRNSTKAPSSFQWPLMKQLKRCEFRLTFSLLELQGHPSSLERFFPVLTELRLNQTIPLFRKWVDHSCFHSVTSLNISLCIGNRDANGDFYVNFDSSTMLALKNAFPNLLELAITIERIQLPSPTFSILWTIKSLRSLTITLCEATSSDELAAIFVGVSVDDVSRLSDCPDLWNELRVTSSSSIRNLTELKTLRLTSMEAQYQLIPDVTFLFAFFKMPKLIKLMLYGGFFPTEEMEEKWIMEERKFETYEPFDRDYYRQELFSHERSEEETTDDDSDSDFE